MTIDRARHARLKRDSVLQAISMPRGVRRLAVAGLIAGAVGLAVGGWLVAALMSVIGVLGQIWWWWFRTGAAMRAGLGVGQSLRVDYADSGEIAITDITGQIWLPRGSAYRVVRYRGNITVGGRAVSFILPGEMLTDVDAAFLEGHGAEPQEATTHGPNLPLSLEMTADRQERLIAAGTAVVVRSADFLVPWLVTAPVVIGITALVGSPRAIALAVAFCALCAYPGLRGLGRTRSRIRSAYPIGRTIRAGVSRERMVLSLPHSTRTMEWSEYIGLRVTSDAVLLRKTRRPLAADTTAVLPVDLFNAVALADLAVAVPGRFEYQGTRHTSHVRRWKVCLPVGVLVVV